MNYLEDFDDNISKFDDGKSGNRNTGLYSNKTKKAGMNSRHDDIFDVRSDAVKQERKNANQVMNIGNILNDTDDQEFFN